MAALTEIRVEISFAWWLQPYLSALTFFCILSQREPDLGKLGKVIAKAIRIKATR